jgi:hypothetical protein
MNLNYVKVWHGMVRDTHVASVHLQLSICNIEL